MNTDLHRRLVSVVMPLYNAENFVRRAMESVLVQTHRLLELIVVDDKSTDSSLSVASAVAGKDPRVRVLRNPRNLGVAEARNRALAAATGRYVAFLDSDDWWLPGKLEKQLAALATTGAAIAYGSYRRVDEDGRCLGVVVPPPSLTHADMLRSNRIGHSTGIFDRHVVGEDVRFQAIGHEDYAFWLDLMRGSSPAVGAGIDGPIACYRVREGSISSNKARAVKWQWHIYRRHQQLGLLASTWYMANYATLALSKRRAPELAP
ncbi:MAG: glycosyltransferase family 2 protein [Gammaproteobacteria bacterium]|nr:glycosyltransferase family 2 protein [Gammaproteobacteria bacterium]